MQSAVDEMFEMTPPKQPSDEQIPDHGREEITSNPEVRPLTVKCPGRGPGKGQTIFKSF
jgi:hypothetical protein